MPHEGLMAMVGVWGRVWFVCRGVVSGVKRVRGGTEHVHSPKARESETESQVPRRRVNSQMDDGAWTERQDIIYKALKQYLSRLRYVMSHQTRTSEDAVDVRLG